MADPGVAFKPYVPANEEPRELTARALVIGSLLGIFFGASTVYLGLKVGLTVSASIPIAVLSIPIFRALRNGSILENNITQTVGSAGESIAAGAAFTLPALLVMGYDLDVFRSTLVAMTGGWLGVLLMIPLRRSLIVKEHGKLTYPEGTACAEVLETGEKRGNQAKLLFLGLGIGMVDKFLYRVLGLWKETPGHVFGGGIKNASIAVEVAPELMGVGYIIGPRIAGVMLAGGIMSFLVLIPLVQYFGTTFGGPDRIAEFATATPGYIRNTYIFYIGVGAVAAGGFISLARAIPTIIKTFGAAVSGFTGAGRTKDEYVPRTERDLPISFTLVGVIVIAIFIAAMRQLHVNWLAGVLIVVFGFFFATVSSRICGQIGSSSNPISGMTIATLLLTSLIFVAVGWSGSAYRPIALMVGAIVCVAAANAGATSQDLKTGFLVGATPRRQQIGLLVGVTTAALVVGWTLYFFNRAYTTVEDLSHPKVKLAAASMIAVAPKQQGDQLWLGGSVALDDNGTIKEYRVENVPADAPKVMGKDDKEYRQVHFAGDRKAGVPDGKLLVDEAGVAHYAMSPGISVGGTQAFTVADPTKKLDAPKAQLMALIIDGILEGGLPWALVLFGVFIALVLELCAVEALPFAVGLYLPLPTSAAIFVGGLIRTMVGYVKRQRGVSAEESDAGRGVLLASGLIAGSAFCGLIAGAIVFARGGREYNLAHDIGGLIKRWADSSWSGIIMFTLLALFVFWQAVMPDRPDGQIGTLGEKK